MSNPKQRSRLAGAVMLVISSVAAAPRLSAADSPSAYVSDQFKVVATRVLSKIVADEIKKACEKKGPACAAMAEPLGDAIQAAIDSNQPKLKQSLNAFFMNSSAGALIQTIGKDASGLMTSPEWPVLSARFNACISSTLAGRKAARESCRFSQADLAAAKELIDIESCEKPNIDPIANFCDLKKRAVRGESIPPGVVALALADVAGKANRADLRVYFFSLQRFLDYGLADGLFGPTKEFLLADTDTVKNAEVLIDSLPGDPKSIILSTAGDEGFSSAIATCGLSKDPYEQWRVIRDTGAWLETSRHAFLGGQRVDLASLDSLLAYDQSRCANGSAKKKIARLKDAVNYLIAPIKMHQAISEYGPAALGAAALIDYARTNDEAEFRRNLVRILGYEFNRATYKRLILGRLLKESSDDPLTRVTIQGLSALPPVETVCELRDVEIIIGLPRTTQGPVCYSLATGSLVAVSTLATVATGIPSSEWLQQHAGTLESAANRLLSVKVSSAVVLSVPEAEALSETIRYLKRGKLDVATSFIVQSAVEFLVDRTSAAAKDWLQVKTDDCLSNAHSHWTFLGWDRGCTLYVVAQSAYGPLVDYFTIQASSNGQTAEVAQSFYENLLASPALARLPIILNVGLGVNVIRGSDAVWGSRKYATFTVIDKIGLAVYKRTAPNYEFEIGPFAGGFLDALARTASNDGKSNRYWLLGGTMGFPRMFGWPFGLEVHVAEAMPFTLNAKDHYGLAYGGALVIPWNMFFKKGG